MTFFKNNMCLAVKDIKCSNCVHAHKVDEIEYACDAEEYDIKELTCFVPKEE